MKYIFELIFTTKHYMPSWHCIDNNNYIGYISIVLCAAIVVGYLKIAYHWYSNFRKLKSGLPKSSLLNMVNIFLFCGICGYTFPIIMMWYPIWGIRLIFLVALCIFTWKYALNTKKLNVIYEEIHESGHLTEQIENQKVIQKDIKNKTNEFSQHVDDLSDSVFFGINETTSPQVIEKINKIRTQIIEVEKLKNELKKLTDGS